MMLSFMIIAIIGFAISSYAYVVERKIKNEPAYRPACDISDMISCSKPMKSKYSSMFFLPFGLLGMIFYALVGVLAYFDASKLLLIAAIGALIVCCFLAYLLYFKIKSFCLICTSLYVLNLIFLILAVMQVR